MFKWANVFGKKHPTNRLHQLAQHDRNGAELKAAINQGGNLEEALLPQGFTPLHTAVLHNNLVAVTILLESGANPISRDREGVTPFGVATEAHENPMVLQLLIDYGAMEDILNPREWTPAHPLQDYTFWRDQDEDVILAKLEDIPDMNDSDSLYHDHKPLHMATGADRSLTVIRALLAKGANPNALNHNGNTPLHLAAQRSTKPEVVRELAERSNTINSQNKDGNTPLHCANRDNPNPRIGEVLLQCGADSSITNLYGETPDAIETMPPNVKPVRLNPYIFKFPNDKTGPVQPD